MVDVIERGEPALMLGHWTGVWWNGQKLGLKVWQDVVRRLHARFDNLLWMKLSEVSRYWAAKELTRIERAGNRVALRAPFACPDFTMRFTAPANSRPRFASGQQPSTPLSPVAKLLDLKPGTFHRDGGKLTLCFNLPKGNSELRWIID